MHPPDIPTTGKAAAALSLLRGHHHVADVPVTIAKDHGRSPGRSKLLSKVSVVGQLVKLTHYQSFGR